MAQVRLFLREQVRLFLREIEEGDDLMANLLSKMVNFRLIFVLFLSVWPWHFIYLLLMNQIFS
jgi:hypothetical protein